MLDEAEVVAGKAVADWDRVYPGQPKQELGVSETSPLEKETNQLMRTREYLMFARLHFKDGSPTALLHRYITLRNTGPKI